MEAETNEPLLPITKHPKSKNPTRKKATKQKKKTNIQKAKETANKSNKNNKNKYNKKSQNKRKKNEKKSICKSTKDDLSDLSLCDSDYSDQGEIVFDRRSLAEKAVRTGKSARKCVGSFEDESEDESEDDVVHWYTHPRSEYKVIVDSTMETEEMIEAVTSVQDIDFDEVLEVYNQWVSNLGMNPVQRQGMSSLQAIGVFQVNVCPFCCRNNTEIGCSFCDQWFHYKCARIDQSVNEWKCDFCLKGIKHSDIDI